ncbi:MULTISPECIES: hypothetical protein [Bradyrhizobium]|uniref:hypothetical protein n=1 Tax=Bradyrhizobium TaxID=374 RepID=UPI002227FE9B|nr:MULTISPECIES: hypothetical protein [Bradyrhizobium]MCW2358845.1 mannosyltransferase OCH1-like enzyme [Bradyrhizobium elkanii]MDI2055838.1 hypothetical protein [Bradyrhizobium sp. Mp19]
MKKEYRDYITEFCSGKWIAKPMDGDQFEMRSVYPPRLNAAIDALHAALEQIPTVPVAEITGPRWLREWLARPTVIIDLDAAYARGAC